MKYYKVLAIIFNTKNYLLYMRQIRIPGNADNIVKNVLHQFKTFFNFRLSENEPKKRAISAAGRKRNQRILKLELMNTDIKNEYHRKANKQRHRIMRKTVTLNE